MKKFFKDFKEFISRGNVVDLAVAVVVGGAFGKIVSSLVNNIIMPLITLATGGVSIEDWKWVIKPADAVAGTAENALSYGIFIQSIIDFLIIAFFIFLAIRLIQRSKNKLEKVAEGLKKSNGKTDESEATEEAVVAVELTGEDAAKSILEFQNANDASNKKQEKLLEEIRDLLKK